MWLLPAVAALLVAGSRTVATVFVEYRLSGGTTYHSWWVGTVSGRDDYSILSQPSLWCFMVWRIVCNRADAGFWRIW